MRQWVKEPGVRDVLLRKGFGPETGESDGEEERVKRYYRYYRSVEKTPRLFSEELACVSVRMVGGAICRVDLLNCQFNGVSRRVTSSGVWKTCDYGARI